MAILQVGIKQSFPFIVSSNRRTRISVTSKIDLNSRQFLPLSDPRSSSGVDFFFVNTKTRPFNIMARFMAAKTKSFG